MSYFGQSVENEDFNALVPIERFYPDLAPNTVSNATSESSSEPLFQGTRILYWYHPDYVSNVDLVTDVNGEAYELFLYNAWGESLHHWTSNSSNSWSSPYRFNSKELDPETGMHYYGARYHHPKLSVWMSVDRFSHYYPENTPYEFMGSNTVLYSDPSGDTLEIRSNDVSLLFTLDDGKEECATITAKEAYDQGIQWFESNADNYMPILSTSEGLYKKGKNAYAKHFTSSDIDKFSNIKRPLISFRSGGRGDWKESAQGADGYFLVTVDGYPIWSDAIGQIPFAVAKFRSEIESGATQDEAIVATIKAAKKYGNGNIFFPQDEPEGSYDIYFVLRGVLREIYGDGILNQSDQNLINFYIK